MAVLPQYKFGSLLLRDLEADLEDSDTLLLPAYGIADVETLLLPAYKAADGKKSEKKKWITRP